MKATLRMLLALLALAAGGLSANAESANPLVGTWRLLSFTSEILQTKRVMNPFGAHPDGLLTYTADGRMILILINPSRQPPAAPAPTDAEAVRMYRTMIAYAGTYRVDGNRVVHHIQIAWNQRWAGTDQQRFFKIEGDRLTITTAPLKSTVLHGETVVSSLVLERVR